MQEYHHYPLAMRHPSRQMATPRHRVDMTGVSPELAQSLRVAPGASQTEGRPDMYPDVIVQTADEEAYYVSRGYAPAGGANPAGARTIQAAPLPANYRADEWPRTVGGKIVTDPNAKPATNEYPKHIQWCDTIVYNEDEERALMASKGNVVSLADVETLPKEPVPRRRGEAKPRKVYGPPSAEKRELIRMARDLGLKFWPGYPVERLRKMIEEATAPAAE
jgi:hypothetical protein